MRQRNRTELLRWLPALILGLAIPGTVPSCKKAINDGAAGAACTTQSECGPGLVCDCATETCQPADRGNPYCANQDARIPEAGTEDAAVDAAPLQDAEPTDAATDDAAIEDGGTSDASVQDLDAATNQDAKVDAS